MAEEGSRQIPVVGKDDKREITALLAATAAGALLPPTYIRGQDYWMSPKSHLSREVECNTQ